MSINGLSSNTIYCADCDRGMHYKANSKGYVCGNYNKHGSKACSNHLTRESTLCLAILNDIKNLFTSLGSNSYLDTIDAKVQKQRLLSQKQINSTKEKIAALKSKKQKVVGLLVEEVISKEAYDEYIDNLNKQIHLLTINVKDLETHLNTKDDKTSLFELKDN